MERIHIITAIEDFIEGKSSFKKFKEECDNNYKHYQSIGEEDTFLSLIDEPVLCLNIKHLPEGVFDKNWNKVFNYL